MKGSSRSIRTASLRSLLSQKSHSSSNFVATTSTAATAVDAVSLRGGSQKSLGRGGGGSLDTGLHYRKLEELLCVRIPSYFKKIKSAQFLGLAERSSRRQLELLKPAICYLENALAAPESKDFSFDVMVDVQSTLGLMYEMQGDSQTAIDYYMTALWLLHKPFKSGASVSKGYDLNTQVAINLYRLGASYGKLGDTGRMHAAYDRAEWFREGDIFIAMVRH